jgi:hypothetical protein
LANQYARDARYEIQTNRHGLAPGVQTKMNGTNAIQASQSTPKGTWIRVSKTAPVPKARNVNKMFLNLSLLN